MACNCKRVEKIQNMLPNANNQHIEKKGLLKLIYQIWGMLLNVLIKFAVLILFVVVTPIVILMLSFNFIFKGKATIFLPEKIGRHFIEKDKQSKEEPA